MQYAGDLDGFSTYCSWSCGIILPSLLRGGNDTRSRAGFNIKTLVRFDTRAHQADVENRAVEMPMTRRGQECGFKTRRVSSSRAPRSLPPLSFPLLLRQPGRPPDRPARPLSCSGTFSFSSLSRLRLLLAPHAPSSCVSSSWCFSRRPGEEDMNDENVIKR